MAIAAALVGLFFRDFPHAALSTSSLPCAALRTSGYAQELVPGLPFPEFLHIQSVRRSRTLSMVVQSQQQHGYPLGHSLA
ncbi:hypothetical protein BOTBODRAFT_397118 [Botryobasidium botryosum FD-172 SS1]|uniref:Uncharacterized protein n=1 Tax=Botryobasidium botryosum (strain FD-172 SS1) TaxID=930990 RepID=A0A067MBN3_BOTB1|nr:hypothetical protein BOTBODRAFT_397118 [Botryobasidium botryosum FD-172 SS1]